MKKLFVVKKYVWAKDAREAIKLEAKTSVDDVWVDDDWKKQQDLKPKEVGFKK
jgi:hypothetical protein